MGDTGSAGGAGLLALREKVLQQRQEALEGAGLTSARHELDALTSAAAASSKSRKRKRQEQEAEQNDIPAELLRRSGRLALMPAMNFYEDALLAADARAAMNATASSSSRGGSGVESVPSGPPPPPRAPAPPAAGSSRSLPARISWLNTHYLGRYIPVAYAGGGNQAKRAVMAAACGRQGVSFNKYAGLQEFKDAVVLFVNLFGDADGGNAKNVFLDGGRAITWYASDKAHDNSSSILRLIHHDKGGRVALGGGGSGRGSSSGAAAAAADDDEGQEDAGGGELRIAPCPVALVVRLASDGPYVYCGQLRYRAHSAGSQPLRFEFDLVHYNELVEDMKKSETATRGGAGGKGSSSSSSRSAAANDEEDEDEDEDDGSGAIRGGGTLDKPLVRAGRSHFRAVLAAGRGPTKL